MHSRFLVALTLGMGLALSAPSSFAKPNKADAAAAKKALAQGKKHEGKKDWEAAREAYQKALELNDTPGTRLRLAKAEEKLGNLVEAAEQLRLALESKKLNFAQRRGADRSLKSLGKRIPSLRLELPGGFDGKVTIDDEEVSENERIEPVHVNPGTRVVRAEAEGFLPFKESFELAEGEEKVVTVLLTEKPKEKAAPAPVKAEAKSSGSQRTLGYISLAVGGAGLVVGGAMGLAARSTRSELETSCPNDVCSERNRDLYDKGKTQADIATAGFIVGGVGLSLGAVLLLTASDDGEKPAEVDSAKLKLTPVVGPAQVGVLGRF